jgi:hypothetical protein
MPTDIDKSSLINIIYENIWLYGYDENDKTNPNSDIGKIYYIYTTASNFTEFKVRCKEDNIGVYKHLKDPLFNRDGDVHNPIVDDEGYHSKKYRIIGGGKKRRRKTTRRKTTKKRKMNKRRKTNKRR